MQLRSGIDTVLDRWLLTESHRLMSKVFDVHPDGRSRAVESGRPLAAAAHI
jgi:hypothetical protein